MDTLDHLSFLPLGIVHRKSTPSITKQKLEAYRAILLYDRVSSIDLHCSPLAMNKLFRLMDKSFPILKSLSLISMHQQDENLLAVLDLVLLGPIVPQVRT